MKFKPTCLKTRNPRMDDVEHRTRHRRSPPYDMLQMGCRGTDTGGWEKAVLTLTTVLYNGGVLKHTGGEEHPPQILIDSGTTFPGRNPYKLQIQSRPAPDPVQRCKIPLYWRPRSTPFGNINISAFSRKRLCIQRERNENTQNVLEIGLLWEIIF